MAEDIAVAEVNVEQLVHNLEKKQVQLQSELNKTVQALQECRTESIELERKLEKAAEEIKLAKIDVNKKADSIIEKDLQISKLEKISNHLQEELDHSSSETERLKSSRDSLDKELNEVQQNLVETREHLWSLQGESARASQEVISLRRLYDSVSDSLKVAECDAMKYSNQVLEVRKEFAHESLEMKKRMNDAEAEVCDLKQTVSSLEERLLQKSAVAFQAEESLRDALQQHADDRASLESELLAQARIASLHMENSENLELRLGVAEKTIDYLHKQADTIAEQCNIKLHEERERHLQALAELRQLSQENLNDMRMRLEESEKRAICGQPTTASDVISGAIEGVGDITRVDMMDRLVSTERELGEVKAEKAKLTLCLNRVCTEIQQKAPSIASQKMEHSRLLEVKNRVTEHLENTLLKCRKLEEENAKIRQIHTDETRELNQLRFVNKSLALQVQTLLKRQVEMNQNRTVGDGAAGHSLAVIVDDTIAENQDKLIEENFVTFDNIIDLQIRNQNLLGIIRNLKDDIQIMESERKSPVIERELAKIASLKEEILNMAEERKNMADMMHAMTEQRDMYRTLHLQQLNQLSSTGDRSFSVGEISNLNKKVDELEKELTAVKEVADMRLRSEKCANEALEEANQISVKARQEAAHASAAAAFSEKRYQAIQETLRERQQYAEVMAARTKVQSEQYEHALIKVEELDAQLDSARTEVRLLQAQVQRLSSERDLAKDSVSHLQKEIATATTELGRQSALMDSLQKIERAFSSRAIEDRKGLEEEVKRLRLALDQERRKAENLSVLSTSSVETSALEVKEIRMKLDEALIQLQNARELAIQEQGNAKAANSRLEVLEKQLMTSREGKDSDTCEASIAQITINTLEADLKEAHIYLEAAKEEAEKAQEHVKQYQAIAKARETQLAEFKEAKEVEISALKSNLEHEKARGDALETEKIKISENMREIAVGLVKDRENAENRTAQIKAEISRAKSKEENALKKADEFKHQADVLKEELEDYRKSARSAQESYEREHNSHAITIANLRSTEEKYTAAKAAKDAAEGKLSKISAEFTQAQAEWLETSTRLEREKSAAEKRTRQVMDQNSILHSQLTTAAKQVEILQQERLDRAEAGLDEATDILISEGDEEVERLRQATIELREVVRYQRKEKEVAEAKLEMANSVLARQKAALDHTEAKLKEAKEELIKASQEPEERIASRAEYERLLDQVSQLSALRESNTVLRAQAAEARQNLASAEAKVNELAQKLEPSEKQHALQQAEIESMRERAVSAERQIKEWKNRVDVLLSSQNRIDPEAHRQLQFELESARSLLEMERINAESELAKVKEKAKSELATAIATEKESKIQLRANLKKEIAIVNASMKELEMDLKLTKEELVKCNDERKADATKLKELQESITNVEQERSSLQRLLDGNQEKTTRLREFMRNLKNQLERTQLERDAFKEQITNLEKTISSANVVSPTIVQTSALPSTSKLTTSTISATSESEVVESGNGQSVASIVIESQLAIEEKARLQVISNLRGKRPAQLDQNNNKRIKKESEAKDSVMAPVVTTTEKDVPQGESKGKDEGELEEGELDAPQKNDDDKVKKGADITGEKGVEATK